MRAVGANKCEACARASNLVRGGKCAMHESSTSPSVDRAFLNRIESQAIGSIGPVPFVLAGGDLGSLSHRDADRVVSGIFDFPLERKIVAPRSSVPLMHDVLRRSALERT